MPKQPASDSIGKVDAAVAPLVGALNAAGVRTFQSCSGHEGAESHPSGHVWLLPEYDVCEYFDNARWLSEQLGIEQVALLWGRERENGPVFEVVFAGETRPEFRAACDAIVRAFTS